MVVVPEEVPLMIALVPIVGEVNVRPDTDVVVPPKDRAVEPRVVVPVALVLALVKIFLVPIGRYVVQSRFKDVFIVFKPTQC